MASNDIMNIRGLLIKPFIDNLKKIEIQIGDKETALTTTEIDEIVELVKDYFGQGITGAPVAAAFGKIVDRVSERVIEEGGGK